MSSHLDSTRRRGLDAPEAENSVVYVVCPFAHKDAPALAIIECARSLCGRTGPATPDALQDTGACPPAAPMLSVPCANGRSNSQPSQPLLPVLEQQNCSVRQDCYNRLPGASGGAPAAPGLADGPEPRVTLQVWQLFPQCQLV